MTPNGSFNGLTGEIKLTQIGLKKFWSRIDKKGPDDCWLWTGLIDKRPNNRYGRFHLSKREVRAHRVAWVLENGQIPKGLQVLHNCPGGNDRPECCNPRHLWLGTNDENMADMVAKGRQVRGERQHSAKLDEDKVREIRRRHAAGESPNQLANEYGVVPSAVYFVVSRQHWAHVT